ncbi:MAG: hypothetical protein GF310_13935 [candidate division Zixibacteria bacterium]|nr:hypothetical protein [candidate division Zixibacteria bacterium]
MHLLNVILPKPKWKKLFLLVFLIPIIGCVNSMEPPPEGSIVITPNEWTAPDSGGTSPQIQISSSFDPIQLEWRIEVDSPWLMVLKDSGVTPGAFMVIAESNMTEIDRSGRIKVIVENLPDSIHYLDVFQPHRSGIFWLGEYNSPGSTEGMHTEGNYIYISGWGEGLQIVDITEPASPFIVSWYPPQGASFEIFKAGEYVYMPALMFDTYRFAFQIFDVSNVLKPVLKTIVSTGGVPAYIWADSKNAYIADARAGLLIYNVQDVSNPELVAEYGPGSINRVFCVRVTGNYAYVGSSNEFRILDVSEPSNPQQISIVNTPHAVEDIFLHENRAYMAFSQAGIKIYNVADPENPVFLGDCTDIGNVYRVFVEGDYLYVADRARNGGVHVLDISDPAKVHPVAHYTRGVDARTRDVLVRDKIIFMGDSYGLHVLKFIP